MSAIGGAMVEFIRDVAQSRGKEPFAFDLTTRGRKDLLITRRGDVARVKQQLSDPDWIDSIGP